MSHDSGQQTLHLELWPPDMDKARFTQPATAGLSSPRQLRNWPRSGAPHGDLPATRMHGVPSYSPALRAIMAQISLQASWLSPPGRAELPGALAAGLVLTGPPARLCLFFSTGPSQSPFLGSRPSLSPAAPVPTILTTALQPAGLGYQQCSWLARVPASPTHSEHQLPEGAGLTRT